MRGTFEASRLSWGFWFVDNESQLLQKTSQDARQRSGSMLSCSSWTSAASSLLQNIIMWRLVLLKKRLRSPTQTTLCIRFSCVGVFNFKNFRDCLSHLVGRIEASKQGQRSNLTAST
jgi:hypothetical protein